MFHLDQTHMWWMFNCVCLRCSCYSSSHFT